MRQRQVVIFGGTGFLGRAVTRACLRAGHKVRVASRRPEAGWQCSGGPDSLLQFVHADIGDPALVAPALAGADMVVNAVSLYVERGGISFRDIHVEGARRVARLARIAGATSLVHVSDIGADRHARSSYIRSRGEGEAAVAAAFPGAALVRPAVMFGSGDALLGRLADMVRELPVLPLFGSGRTRLQPVHVDDVAAAIARLAAAPRLLCELGGPQIFTWRRLVELVCSRLDRHPLLLPLPFAAWRLLAVAAERLPEPPLTRGQVALMRRDNVADARLPGLQALGIAATPIAETLLQLPQGAPRGDIDVRGQPA